VTNCVLRTNANDFKFGTESSGGFKNIAFSNSVILARETGGLANSGISIESVDGGHVEGVVISNISMRDVKAPIFIRLGNRGRGLDPPVSGTLEDVSIQNIIATGCTLASSITGIPGHVVRHIALEGLNLTMTGGVQAPAGLDVPEVEAKYPSATMFGPLPAYAFYARHVEGLRLGNIQTRWASQDARPALIFDDVKDLELHGFKSDTVAASQPVLWMNDTMNVFVRGSSMAAGQKFVRLTGTRTSDVKLVGNDFSGVAEPIEYGPGVAQSVVRAVANVLAPTPGGR